MKKIAILILAHKSPKQLFRLLSSINDSRFDIYIHVDKKTNLEIFKDCISKTTNVYFIPNRIKTYLNDISLVFATLNLIEEASKKNYLYYTLITGQDYPIKSNDYIYEFLHSNYPTLYLDHFIVGEHDWCKNYGLRNFWQKPRKILFDILGPKLFNSKIGSLNRTYIVCFDVISTLFTGKPISVMKKMGFSLSTGSHFWMLPDIAVNYILHEVKRQPQLFDVFSHIPVPEECFFQTIITNSYLENYLCKKNDNIDKELSLIDNCSFRYIKWLNNGVRSNGHPYTITVDDYEKLKKAKALFARKFDIDIDNKIFDLIDHNR